jgi:hypothetical protein
MPLQGEATSFQGKRLPQPSDTATTTRNDDRVSFEGAIQMFVFLPLVDK